MLTSLDLIRQFEGFRETPYWDVNAYRTGYGSDTITTADGKVVPVAQGMRVTREDAERDLERRVMTEFRPRAAQAVGEERYASLNPAQQAVLDSLTYNYGRVPESVVAAMASGDPAAVAAAIRALGAHNGGVNRGRREREADIFLGRDPTPLAYAYANGNMPPEDAALYEKGAKEGVLPFAGALKQENTVDPLDIYRRIAMGRG